MRLMAFEQAGIARLGLVQDDTVIDLAEAAPDLPRDLTGLVRAGASAFVAAAQAGRAARPAACRALSGLRFLPPIQNPGKIICLGLNYADHAKEGGHAKPEYPSFFMRCGTSLVAHGEAMLRPQVSIQLDYEAELVAVVGRTARHVAKTSQWTIGKNFDRTGGFGPWFITADELPPGAAGLTIESRLNGQVMQHANTRDMIVPVAETVALLTECLTLEPGDLLVMGTPAGVGHARKPPVWMKDGDTIEIEIEGIGVLSNPIKDEMAAR